MPDKQPTIADSSRLCDTLISLLEDGKGLNITRMDVSKLTTMADFMVVVSGTSSRHVRALAVNTVDSMREKGVRPRGVEGEDSGEWILLDFGDVIVHVMQKSVREHYDLEGLWQAGFSEVLQRRAREVVD
jgi:ribosome-associated protein